MSLCILIKSHCPLPLAYIFVSAFAFVWHLPSVAPPLTWPGRSQSLLLFLGGSVFPFMMNWLSTFSSFFSISRYLLIYRFCHPIPLKTQTNLLAPLTHCLHQAPSFPHLLGANGPLAWRSFSCGQSWGFHILATSSAILTPATGNSVRSWASSLPPHGKVSWYQVRLAEEPSHTKDQGRPPFLC
jgi:hypothetical protein